MFDKKLAGYNKGIPVTYFTAAFSSRLIVMQLVNLKIMNNFEDACAKGESQVNPSSRDHVT